MLPLQRSTLYFSVQQIPKEEEQVPSKALGHQEKGW